MNEIKFDLDNKLDGAKTYRGQNPRFNNSSKQYNFPNSPKNKNIKYLNLGNINTNQISKYTSKGNSPNQILSENIKRAYKQNLNNHINQSNNTNSKLLKENDNTNNFNGFKKIKELNNERIFQKGVLNDKLESLLFKNKLKSKNNNKLLNSNKILNNLDNTSRLKLKEQKIDLTSFIDFKNQPLLQKFNNKRSSSVLNYNKANNNLKENNFIKKDSLLLTKYSENEKIKTVRTPSNKNVEIDKNKSINDFKIKKRNNKIKILELEENHFKAVLYAQEIKMLKQNLE